MGTGQPRAIHWVKHGTFCRRHVKWLSVSIWKTFSHNFEDFQRSLQRTDCQGYVWRKTQVMQLCTENTAIRYERYSMMSRKCRQSAPTHVANYPIIWKIQEKSTGQQWNAYRDILLLMRRTEHFKWVHRRVSACKTLWIVHSRTIPTHESARRSTWTLLVVPPS